MNHLKKITVGLKGPTIWVRPLRLAPSRRVRWSQVAHWHLGVVEWTLVAGLLRKAGSDSLWDRWPGCLEVPLASIGAQPCFRVAQRRCGVKIEKQSDRSCGSSSFFPLLLALLFLPILLLRILEDQYARSQGFPGALLASHPLKAMTFSQRAQMFLKQIQVQVPSAQIISHLRFELSHSYPQAPKNWESTQPPSTKLQRRVEQATLIAWKERFLRAERAEHHDTPRGERLVGSPSPRSRPLISPLERFSPCPLDVQPHSPKQSHAPRQAIPELQRVMTLDAVPSLPRPKTAAQVPKSEIRSVKQWLRVVMPKVNAQERETDEAEAPEALRPATARLPLTEQLRRWCTRLALREEVWLEFTLGSLRAECLLLADTMLTMHAGFVAVVDAWSHLV
eukprot:g26823.t1